jgi:hypothetical protein
MILIIEKEANNLFSITYDGGEPIRTEQNRLTTIGDFSNFKTANGANLVLKQNIPVTEITVIASGTFTFTTMPQLWNKLIQIGFFDGVVNSGGGSVISRFDELADTFNYFGRDGQVVTVNESQLRLETRPISLFTPADRDKLDGIQAGAEVNVQADASVTDPNNPAYIKNFPNIPDIIDTLTWIKSNDSLSLAQRKGDVLYGILDQYTGEEITLSKITETPTVDGVIYFQLGSEFFKRNYDSVNVRWFGAKGDGVNDDSSAFTLASIYNDIYVPSGNYIMSGVSFRRNNVVFKGESSATTFLKMKAGVNSILIELGETSWVGSPLPFKNINISGFSLDGNSENTPIPSIDLTGQGIALTNTSFCNIEDVKIKNTHNAGFLACILSNYNNISVNVTDCGKSLISGTYYPAFDINSCENNIYNVISSNSRYGARLVDNCKNNTLNVIVKDCSLIGLIYANSGGNVSFSNIINATVENGCVDGGIQIGDDVYNSAITATVNGVTGIGLYETDDSARNNTYNVNTSDCGGQSILSYGNNGNWKINSYKDGRAGVSGSNFAVDIYGDRNTISATIIDEGTPQVRGLVFRTSSNNNELNSLVTNGLVSVIDNFGTNNSVWKTSQGDYVRLSGDQDVTGIKNHLSGLKTQGDLEVLNSSGVGSVFIDGAQSGHRKYAFQNVRTGVSNEGFQIRDVTGGFSPITISETGIVDFPLTATAPTAVAGTNTTQIATTAFVSQNTVTLTGNQTVAGRKSIVSSNATLSGLTLTNTRTTNTGGTSDSAIIEITNSGTAGISVNSTAGTAITASNDAGVVYQAGKTGAAVGLNINDYDASGTGDVISYSKLGSGQLFRVLPSGQTIGQNATALNHLVTKAQTLYTNQTITANKTVTISEFANNNELILSVNATSGNITITLPTFTALQGYKLTVKKMDSSANSVLIQGVGGINIDGSASVIISGQYSSSTIGANLSQYIIL